MDQGHLNANRRSRWPFLFLAPSTQTRKEPCRAAARSDIAAKGIRFSNTHLYRLIARGDFPKPFKLGKRKNFWDEATIDAWIAARAAA
jgi:predicted DNA-binding transcriptional regulator AlpA